MTKESPLNDPARRNNEKIAKRAEASRKGWKTRLERQKVSPSIVRTGPPFPFPFPFTLSLPVPPSPTPTTSPNAADRILSDAAGIVAGARQQTHGDKERSFEAIASLWNAYLGTRKGGPQLPITSMDVAQMMVLLKIARVNQGDPIRDHFLDAAGYSAIAGEISLGSKASV